jgi:hypothetical protein
MVNGESGGCSTTFQKDFVEDPLLVPGKPSLVISFTLDELLHLQMEIQRLSQV